MLYCTP